MKLNSKMVGASILVVIFGGILTLTALGWWQTGGGGQGKGKHGETASSESILVTNLYGKVSAYDQVGLTIITAEGQTISVQLGNSRYNQSVGFAPQVGENVTIVGFLNDLGLFSAVTVTLDSGQVYTFRDAATGRPAWAGGNGKGGGNH
jgi:hypothetical protein